MAVPLFDLQSPRAPLQADLERALERVVASGAFVLGPETEAFEAELAAYLGAGHAVGVGNGTDALTLALRAMGVGPGDEVVVPSFSYFATAGAVPPTGARPVFCDVDHDSACVTAETVRPALTPRTRAVVAVHLFGNVAPVAEIEALGVPVLEDAAQAAGSRGPDGRPGALGTAAAVSFFPTKNLGCFGDGGAVVTGSAELAERVRTLRFHGSPDRGASFTEVGVNSRLDELQAAVLRVQLPHLDAWARARGAAADEYRAAGLGELVQLPRPTPGSAPAWHLHVVRAQRADELAAHLAAAGVGARAYYRTPIHRQPAMRRWAPTGPLAATEELARTHLALPMGPALSPEQVREVVGAVRAGPRAP